MTVPNLPLRYRNVTAITTKKPLGQRLDLATRFNWGRTRARVRCVSARRTNLYGWRGTAAAGGANDDGGPPAGVGGGGKAPSA
jgi:hypothetical protein